LSEIKADAKAVFRVATERMHLFDPESGVSLAPHDGAGAREVPTAAHEAPPQSD
jgi:hypothetical protein